MHLNGLSIALFSANRNQCQTKSRDNYTSLAGEISTFYILVIYTSLLRPFARNWDCGFLFMETDLLILLLLLIKRLRKEAGLV